MRPWVGQTLTVDVPSNAAKAWFFQTDRSQFNAGLVLVYDERNYPNVTFPFRQHFTLAQVRSWWKRPTPLG